MTVFANKDWKKSLMDLPPILIYILYPEKSIVSGNKNKIVVVSEKALSCCLP
ncbi:hypothetical protein [Spirulina sp. 06S082]|uniref:hypothetical protein n=1 Tax=Spirulina sp. 06S082 TaxID=3110248 RepID=UPI002B21A3D4|nr:hypothetical protein [Spirulina sp. 06S082]MEA5467320.1 hypothetical protein [Spirulina sp. 06S082]